MTKKKQEEKTQAVEEDIVIEETTLTIEEQLLEQIGVLQVEVIQLKNDYLKEKADVENTKKRLEKERIIERKYAALPITKQILTPLDNFELALRHVIDNEAVQQFAQGFEMIKTQFTKALAEQGVSEIDALNEEYDPNFHQAIMTEKIEGVEPNIVIDVLQKGFMFKDRIIRPAMVKISE